MYGWPLKSPPQIAADGTSLAGTTGWQNVSLPTRADGSQAKNVLFSWESVADLLVRPVGGTGAGSNVQGYAQPCLLGFPGNTGTIQCALASGTGTIHLTPVEE